MGTRLKVAAIALVAAGTLTLAGLFTAAYQIVTGPAPGRQPAASSTPPPADPGTARPVPDGSIVVVGTVPPGVDPIPPQPGQLDAAHKEKARVAAVAVMRAFAQHGPAAVWWGRLKPLLTDDAQLVYRDVDPALIPATKVTGPGHLGEELPGLVQQVAVPTDAGVFVVDMQALFPQSKSRYLAAKITFPS